MYTLLKHYHLKTQFSNIDDLTFVFSDRVGKVGFFGFLSVFWRLSLPGEFTHLHSSYLYVNVTFLFSESISHISDILKVTSDSYNWNKWFPEPFENLGGNSFMYFLTRLWRAKEYVGMFEVWAFCFLHSLFLFWVIWLFLRSWWGCCWH